MEKQEEEDNTIQLDTFFNSDIKNPFTYNLNLDLDNDDIGLNYTKIFEKIKNIFVQGLLYITDEKNICIDGDKKSVLIDKIPNKDINKVKQYMLSLGIEVIHKEYTDEDKDYEIRRLLYTLQKYLKDEVKIEVTMDWVKQLITKTKLTCDKQKLPELDVILRHYPDANFILKLYTPNKIEHCHMYYNKENQPNILNIIAFKHANIADYQYRHKYATEATKHVR